MTSQEVPAEEVLADPIAVVTALITGLEPSLNGDVVAELVSQVAGGRDKRRRLAAGLASRPEVLLDGGSPMPRAVGELLIVLRRHGITAVAAPRCAACGKALASMERRRGDCWYCTTCDRRSRPQPCGSCGQLRPVAGRDRAGAPRCSRCRDPDERDPLAALTELITALDPSLDTRIVIDCVTRVHTRRQDLRRLAWALEDRPALLTGEGADAPSSAVLRLIDQLRDAGAEKVIRPGCPGCGRVVHLHRRLEGRSACGSCLAKAHAEPCSRCGVRKPVSIRDEQGRPVCSHCQARDPSNQERCIGCGRHRPVKTRAAEGPRCAACRPRTVSTCAICGRNATCTVSKATGEPWCGGCRQWRARCARCGQINPVRGGTREAPLCAGCARPDPGFWRSCPACGQQAQLHDKPCDRCNLAHRVGTIFDDGTGRVAPHLRAMHDELVNTPRPQTTLRWLATATTRQILIDLATGHRQLTHQALDELPPSQTLDHLRAVLVATASLPGRDEQLVRIERWVTQRISERDDPEDKQLLHRYAVWHLLRRLRHRNRATETTYRQIATLRKQVHAAIALLDHLRSHELTLPGCAQPDLDAALATNRAAGRAGHFVRWAASQGINPTLRFSATRWTGPAGPLDHNLRWAHARDLLHNNTIDPADRVAGLLLLLYAQRPATISRLSLDDIDIKNDTVALRLGSIPVVLPEPLATLTRELAITRRGHAVLGAQGGSRWLFPGGQPGRPISAARLDHRLRKIGLHPAQARSTALVQLATELPAAVLARTLGIHIKVAVRWQQASSGDWTNYAAEVSHRIRR